MNNKAIAEKLLELAEALLNPVSKKVCPYCGSVNTVTVPKGKPGTYRCMDCGRNFYLKMQSKELK